MHVPVSRARALRYNKRFGEGDGRRPLSWECGEGEIGAFKRDVIMRHIVDEEATSLPFVQYLHNRRVFADRDFKPAPTAAGAPAAAPDADGSDADEPETAT